MGISHPSFSWDDFGNAEWVFLDSKLTVERKPNPWAAQNPLSTLTFQRKKYTLQEKAVFDASASIFNTSADFASLVTTISQAYLVLDCGDGHASQIYPPSCTSTDWILAEVQLHRDPLEDVVSVHAWWAAYSSWASYDYIEEATRD